MNSLSATSATVIPPAAVAPENTAGACNPAQLYKYHKDLEAWNACQACGRSGFGAVQLENGSWACDTSTQKAGALMSCPAGPVNPCFPMMRPLNSLNPWSQEQSHSWGSSVYDPVYGTHILWGTYDPQHGRPYFAADAPYMRAGLNAPCPPSEN